MYVLMFGFYTKRPVATFASKKDAETLAGMLNEGSSIYAEIIKVPNFITDEETDTFLDEALRILGAGRTSDEG